MEQLDFRKTSDIIKAKVTLRQVMSHYGINLTGKKLITCPFHEDSTPSMQVSDVDTPNGFFYCHACVNKRGDLINFVAFEEGCSLSEALNIIAKRYSVDLETREYTNNLVAQIQENLKSSSKGSSLSIQLEASKNAQKIIFELNNSQHLTPYLVSKKIEHFGTYNKGTTVIVPIMDINNFIWGIQYIYSEGGKSFLKDCKIEGCFLRLGHGPESLAYLAEGYATGASVFMATGITTYVCFTSRNIGEVYKVVNQTYKDLELIVAGDNDISGKKHGLKAVYPPKAGMDWNDVWCSEGKEGVLKYLPNLYTYMMQDKILGNVENPLVATITSKLQKGN